MYIALAIMICGMAAGRILRDFLPQRLLRTLIMGAIFLLLFLLGIAIGSNNQLLRQLPVLGFQSLLLMLACVAGSIGISVLITPLARKYTDRKK